MPFTGTTLVNLDSRTNGLAAIADNTTITNQQTGVTWTGTTKLRKFGYNRRRQQSLLLGSSTGTVTAPSVNRRAFTAYGVCLVSDASVQQVLVAMNGNSLDMLIQINGGVLQNYPVGASTLAPPNAALVGSGRAFAWAVAMDTTVCRYGLNKAPIQTVSHTEASGTLTNNIQVGGWGGGFFQAGEAMQPLIVIGSAQDAATMLANLTYLYEYANWAIAPKHALTLTGTSIHAGYGTSGGNTPAKQLADLLGPDWWVFNDAVVSQTITMMLADDPARLDARLAYPGVSDADDFCVLMDGVTNEIAVNSANGRESFDLSQQYVEDVTDPREIKTFLTTCLSRNDGATNAAERANADALARASAFTLTNGRIVDYARIHSIGGPEAFRDTNIFSDGIHPTNAGAGVMVGAAAGVIVGTVGNGALLNTIDVNVVSASSGALTPAAFSPSQAAIAQAAAYNAGYNAAAIGTALSETDGNPFPLQLVNLGGGAADIDDVPGGQVGATVYRDDTGEYRIVTVAEKDGSVWNLTLDTAFATELEVDERIRVFGGPAVVGEAPTVGEISNALAGATNINAVGIVSGQVMEIVRGNRYTLADGRAWRFRKQAGEPWPTDLTGHTIRFTANRSVNNTATGSQTGSASITLDGTILTATGDDQEVYFEPGTNKTSLFAIGVGAKGYYFDVVALEGTIQKTLRLGVVTVRENQTALG